MSLKGEIGRRAERAERRAFKRFECDRSRFTTDLQRNSKHSFWIEAVTLSLKAVLQLLIHKSGTNNSRIADFIIKRSERET